MLFNSSNLITGFFLWQLTKLIKNLTWEDSDQEFKHDTIIHKKKNVLNTK